MARATVDRLHRVPERVPLLEKDLGEYAPIVGPEVVERIQALAEPLRGCRVLHINATAYGGGVAEILATHVPLLRSVGIDADWQVLRGSDEFFGITKEVHNGLQGADVDWSSRKQRVYLEHVLDNALRLEGEWDFVVAHDPQPVAFRSFLRDSELGSAGTKWIWRCHIDLTDANPSVWEFFRPYVEMHDASVWTMKEFVPDSLSMDRVVEGHPSIDPREFYADPPGALLTAGEHKGYGLSLAIEILGGILSGTGAARPTPGPVQNGTLIICLDPARFLAAGDFHAQVAQLFGFVRSAPLAPGSKEILVPGEPEARLERERRAVGVPLDDETWRQLRECASEAGVA